MKVRMILTTIVLTVVLMGSVASSAQAKPPFKWSSMDVYTFINYWSDWAETRGYRWPALYAACLQTSAARVYRSYYRYISDNGPNSSRWITLPRTGYCISNYGQKWWE